MLVALWIVPAWAGPKGSELKAGQAQLEADLIAATTPVLRQQVTALSALEKRAAVTRDYDTAIAARNERSKIEAELSAQEKLALLLAARPGNEPAETQDRIILKAADAKLDRVRLDPASGVLTDWSAVGASATWKLPGLPPGGYEVQLRYSSGALEGGSVLIQESFYSLTGDLQTTLKGFVDDTIGTLKIRDGTGQLRLSAKSLLKTNLMQLQSVELIPSNR
jgi:hypothetical protein